MSDVQRITVLWPVGPAGYGNQEVVLASEYDAAVAELVVLKSPGPLCFCGLKQSKNPHPEAGVPPGYLEVGTVYDCIPCLNKSRHAWSKKANRLQADLDAAEQRNAKMEMLLREMRGLPQKRCAAFIADIIDLLDATPAESEE